MSEKPIREYDRFILRLPDGMRERLQARAKANVRSMNAEILAMLEQVLDGGGVAEFKAIYEEFERLNRLHKQVSAISNDLNERRVAVMLQMRAIASSDTADSLPEPLKERAFNIVSKINDIFSKHGRD